MNRMPTLTFSHDRDNVRNAIINNATSWDNRNKINKIKMTYLQGLY